MQGGLVAAAIAGDERAFAELWRENQPPLLRYLRVAAGAVDRTVIDDIAADVWMDIVRNLATFRGDEGAFRGWVFTLARRRLIDHWRRAGRSQTHSTDDLSTLERADPSADAADAAIERLTTDSALALIATLPRDQAEVVMLRAVAGLDVARVAQILGKSPAAVRVSAHRGLKTLARRLARTGHELTVVGPENVTNASITAI